MSGWRGTQVDRGVWLPSPLAIARRVTISASQGRHDMKQRTLTAACLCLALAACHTPTAPGLASPKVAGVIDAADFPVPGHLLRGFDYREPNAPWCVGDEVLFGLRLRRGEVLRHWLLRIRVLEVEAVDDAGEQLAAVDWSLRINGELKKFASALCRVEVSVMNELGEEIARSQPLLPRDFLAAGIARACEMMHTYLRQPRTARVPRGAIYDEVRMVPLSEATVAAVALLQVVQEDSVLAPILWQVIEKPSLWSVVTNMGASVVLRPSFHRVTSAPCPAPTLREKTWRLPMRVHVNGQNALNLDLFVTDPGSPFGLAGGLLGATARHPAKAGVDFSLLLLSARRG